MPESLVRFWLGLAAAGSVAATFQVVFWPRWPSASLPSTANLAVDGYTLSPEAGSPAERTSDLAISPTVRYRMVSNGSRPEQASPLTLQLAMLSPRRLGGFQLAAATKERPAWHMSQRRLQQLGDDEIAIGTINNRLSVQTCLTAAEKGAVTEAVFGATVIAPANRRQQLERVLGMRPNRRTDCVLTTISSFGGQQPEAASLLEAFSELRPQLKLLLNP